MSTRTRLATIVTAVSCSVAGGIVLPGAGASITSGERDVFVAIAPCRLFDLRAATQIGGRGTPLGAGERLDEQVTGTNGNCTIPLDATAIAMNVTAVDPTSASFLTVWPADAAQPLASNLNYTAGSPPTPNKVDVKLSATGAISLFNNAGTVNVIADVVGYYADHNHDDRYYTKAQTDAAIAAVPAGAPGAPGGTGATGLTGLTGPQGVGVANPGMSVLAVDDQTFSTGLVPAAAIGVDGLAIIAHNSDGNLRVTHCSDVRCTSSTSTTVDDIAGTVGLSNSIAIGADGLPVIAHFNLDNLALRLTRCIDVACTAANSRDIDDPAGLTAGLANALAIGSDGFPVIAHGTNGSTLRVSHCQDIACLSISTTVVDDPVALIAISVSIAIGVDGFPLIAYDELAANALRVTHCTNLTCTTATTANVDDPAQNVGQGSSIGIGTDGVPVIVSEFANTSSIRVTKCVSLTCATATSTTLVGSSENGPQVAIGSDNAPVIVSRSTSAGNALRVTHCGDLACLSAISIVAADPPGNLAPETNVLIGADGMPLLIASDNTSLRLIVAHCSNLFCTPFTRRN